ncbi:MAG TPA: MMPL family transporter [Solirubrobacteraceae bacterium]|nr:MMPL family transporter [Solirubrobacteraceae bacterium]
MTTLTRWVLLHKRLVTGFWLVVALAAFGAVGPAGDALSQEFSLPGRESYETNRDIATIYGNGGDVAPMVPVVTLPKGTTIDAPGVARELDAALAKVQQALPDARIASYGSTGDDAFVSADRRTTFALAYIPHRAGLEPGQAEARRAQAALEGVTVGGAPVDITGIEALRAAGAATQGADDTSVTLLLEVLLAGLGSLIVLAFVFGSFTALVPLLMAAVAVPTTFLLIWPLTAITDVNVVVQFLVALVGLGIAIDYALLVVMRWREERLAGASNDAAVANAMEHAGRAVVFSGTTVAVALLALVVLPVPFLRSIGIAGLFIPLVSVAVALTLLPVVLATVGPRLDWPPGRPTRGSGRRWTAWAQLVVRHRWAAAIASAAVLLALVGVAFSIQLGDPRAESLAQSGTARAGFEKLADAGLGAGPLSPFEALVRGGDPDAVAERLAGVDGVQATLAPADWRRDGTALVTVIPSEDGSSAAGRATLDDVRAVGLPGVRVGGSAAQGADFVDAVYGNFPLVVALIAGLTFILLARAFRSLVLSLKAVLLNVLSVGAAWGVMVLIWQYGIGSEAIWGIEATSAINVEMPIVVFAFLFGVSMDYQVFIISRMREAYDRTGSTRTAVVEGIGRTGRLVTSAALILGLAFIALSASPGTEVKIFATALAAGILVDATIVRGVLVPAVVAILGRWNWWLPSWPARVLRVRPSFVRAES